MLVIHWAPQNQTSSILANGIRPAARKDRGNGEGVNSRGVYLYPFSRNKTLVGVWRRNLKKWDVKRGNFNGLVLRLQPEDFPLLAGYWYVIRAEPEAAKITSMQELAERYGEYFSGEAVDRPDDGFANDWNEFEIVLLQHVEPRRIIKLIKDREPRRKYHHQ
jgi:hypothetical protein